MSLGYRKRKRLPFGWLNFSKRGVSASVGKRGVSVSKRGLSLGWRGWFWR